MKQLYYGVAGLIILAHAVAVIYRIDSWPLSYYPMASQAYGKTISILQIAGELRDSEQQVEPINVSAGRNLSGIIRRALETGGTEFLAKKVKGALVEPKINSYRRIGIVRVSFEKDSIGESPKREWLVWYEP